MNLTCDDVRDLAPAFVLGALDDAEMAEVRAHLASCAEAHAEVEQLGGAVGYLAGSVDQVEPPESLKARILAAAAAERPPAQIAAVPEVPALAATPDVVPRGVAARVPESLPTIATLRRPVSAGAWAMRLAAVFAIVVLSGWTLMLQGRLDASERYADAVARVVAAAAEPGSQTAILAGADGGGTGIAAVTADGSIVLAIRDLDPTSGSEVYEAWVIAGDGAPIPVGGFTVASDGTGTLEVAGTAASAGATLALTREPGPGAQTPTLPIVSSGVAGAPPG